MYYQKVWHAPENLPEKRVPTSVIYRDSYYVVFDYLADLYDKGRIDLQDVQTEEPLIFHWVVGKN